MPATKFRPTFTFTEERLKDLKAVVPEAFADGQINWETLHEALGNYLEGEGDAEHFGLFWPGKRAARRLAGMPSKGTLIPNDFKDPAEDYLRKTGQATKEGNLLTTNSKPTGVFIRIG